MQEKKTQFFMYILKAKKKSFGFSKITHKYNQIFLVVSGIKYNCDRRLCRDSIWNRTSRLDRWFGVNELRIEEFLWIIVTPVNNAFDCIANK
jgi:hypothetical protein